ncbi:MAG: glycine cleavage system protein GcvH [candidate division KSB1 bacterium]|nr:glycine cleavage system protein GcvH [candidate division KSB1 bacterium]MDZ7335408.1 glycine cleavage system protein GcvH [candidate division KSB1 bacterium]MDZ7356412.1 glycine cleavage system protein GcvH [candidate division KSB1 bacterium]MDZ7376562.1 glycine cleavage system protein GcvH [candidate division KSB1 bacterium]MDZ7401183.1 glycine cleavage system protein GcvH [candidate division KSB1 bacterium]
MEIPKELLYTEEHEWVLYDDTSGVATVGITDYAQSELGDIVFVELPELNQEVKQMEPFGTIEAVKAVSDLFSPVSGTVIEVNTILQDQPELINQDPYDKGWMIKIQISDPAELEALMSPEDYRKHIS